MPRITKDLHIVFEDQIETVITKYELSSRLKQLTEMIRRWRELRTR